MQQKKQYPTGISALPETKEQIRRISAATGKKKYAILAEAVNLWAKVNGYAK